ncbi:MAG: hypothetical protein WBW36_16065 [Candidatus Sulfotelmatobacter sp.]
MLTLLASSASLMSMTPEMPVPQMENTPPKATGVYEESNPESKNPPATAIPSVTVVSKRNGYCPGFPTCPFTAYSRS